MRPGTTPGDPVRDYVEQLLSTGLMLVGLLGDLFDALPDDAYPDEDNGEVLVEMLTGTVRPVLEAAGGRTVEDATALLGAVGDKTLEDLRRASELAARRPRAGPRR